jgi:hypothetical protein
MIATAPMKVEVPSSVYDHRKQSSITEPHKQLAQNRTFGGTRTYDGGGRPFDNDND